MSQGKHMFKLTEDIEIEMKLLYPEVDIELFVHQLLTKIIDKTLQGGACSIREFGKYTAFQTFSNRIQRNVIRLKFKFAPSFIKKIKFDEMLMEKLPVKLGAKFNENNEEKCSKARHRKTIFLDNAKEITKHEETATKTNLGKLEIMKILQED